MQITVTVRTDKEVALVDTFDPSGESVTGIVVLIKAGQTTVELVRPGWKVVIEEIPQ